MLPHILYDILSMSSSEYILTSNPQSDRFGCETGTVNQACQPEMAKDIIHCRLSFCNRSMPFLPASENHCNGGHSYTGIYVLALL